MPKARSAWSCWNYLTSSELDDKGNTRKGNVNQVALWVVHPIFLYRSISYIHLAISFTAIELVGNRLFPFVVPGSLIILWMVIDSMNHLQHIPESKYGPVLVTLNPPFEPEASKVAGRWTYEHPIVSREVSHSPCPSNVPFFVVRSSSALSWLNWRDSSDPNWPWCSIRN